jgi:hypothetical protein
MLDRNVHDDQTYYSRRAREERDRAAMCQDNAVALTHLKFADAYDKKAAGNVPHMQLVGA